MKKGKGKKKGDPPEWYFKAIRMLITDAGEVCFKCRSKECMRTQCKLNLQNPKRKSPVDIYSLIQIFHGYRSAAKAKQIVAEAFQVRLDRFLESAAFRCLTGFATRGMTEPTKRTRTLPDHDRTSHEWKQPFRCGHSVANID